MTNTEQNNKLSLFSLNRVPVRGRLLRQTEFINDLVGSHSYPQSVNSYLREAISMTVLFASLFKFEGIFSVQVIGNGKLQVVACDVTSEGDIRSYASHELAENEKLEQPLGGQIILTIDNRTTGKRYQGIVGIQDGSITKSFIEYFNKSEQVPTSISYFDIDNQPAALLLQQTPDDDYDKEKESSDDFKENWQRIMVLAASVTEEELYNKELIDNDLIFRLFHEEGVVAFDPIVFQAKCRCSEQKAKTVLAGLNPADRSDLAKDGKLIVDCDFCNNQFIFDLDEFET